MRNALEQILEVSGDNQHRDRLRIIVLFTCLQVKWQINKAIALGDRFHRHQSKSAIP